MFRFIELIANAKEQLAVKIQRRHENMVSQLKKEMRKEGEKGKKKYDETKVLHDKVEAIVKHIKDYDKRAFQSEKQREEQLFGHRRERDVVYEEIRSAMIEAHQHATVSWNFQETSSFVLLFLGSFVSCSFDLLFSDLLFLLFLLRSKHNSDVTSHDKSTQSTSKTKYTTK